MSAAILAHDILAICLIAADGDSGLPLEEIIRRVEDFQVRENRHFGISRTDFRDAFQVLCYWELELTNPGGALDGIRLIKVIPELLTYHDAWFNDEGASWSGVEAFRSGHAGPAYQNDWYGCNEEGYQNKMAAKQRMLAFFEKNHSPLPDPVHVREFMRISGISDKVLFTCSRTGEGS